MWRLCTINTPIEWRPVLVIGACPLSAKGPMVSMTLRPYCKYDLGCYPSKCCDILRYLGGPWWRHQMDAFSVLLAICVGNSPVTGEFPTQRPVTRSYDVFFDLRLNKRLSKQSWGWWFETPWRPLWRDSNVLFSEVICQRRSGSTSAQVMACCLTVPSHHLNQYWLIIKTVLWHLSVANFTKDTSAVNH